MSLVPVSSGILNDCTEYYPGTSGPPPEANPYKNGEKKKGPNPLEQKRLEMFAQLKKESSKDE